MKAPHPSAPAPTTQLPRLTSSSTCANHFPEFAPGKRFRRTALLDIDPGTLSDSDEAEAYEPRAARYLLYHRRNRRPNRVAFSIAWHQLGSMYPPASAPRIGLRFQRPTMVLFTTVSHWHTSEWMVDDDGSIYQNDKRSGCLPFMELPKRVSSPLELALHLDSATRRSRAMLRISGLARQRSSTKNGRFPCRLPEIDIQSSRGEFGCAKPAYVKMLTSWISDRTICYLASGRPAIIQDTGLYSLLPGT